MLPIFFLASFFLLGWVNSQDCPYDRLSTQHTFCRKPNPSCDIHHSGVSRKHIEEILKFHNLYRSGIALGKETRARGGTLPQASDMLQMVWDDELAAIAQKWADNCVYQHDCNDCRAVEDYPVGQNIAYQDWLCSDQRCLDTITEEDLEPEWKKVLEDFYMEVEDFDKRVVQKFQQNPGQVIGHFTQLIWSQSWRVGCGFTVFKTGLNYRRFYVCNYGPTGNIRDAPVYKEGNACSACPINSCCGQSCKSAMEYPGLCKMNDPNSAPVYAFNSTGLMFNCDAKRNTRDCAARVSGVDKWKFKSNLIGNYVSIVLDGGESSTVIFKNKISPTKSNFCVRIVFRKGPLKAGEPDRSHLSADFNPTGYLPVHMDLSLTSPIYVPFSLDLSWKADTKFSLTFSVDKNASPQMLEIRQIIAYDGKCNSRTF
ncbi:CRISP/Allergen/PR-1-like [Argiope bruennichi]|uniref:CRISP/Allergen/PR-1-like n=1 Tax=Argiope bruennichi TaxID=94029 RepID=UPI002494B2EB|nr:CRISP/Allergen/PR-1-like [Argiope bruennichi]